MRKKSVKQRGLALVLSIAILALIGTVMFVLTEDARTILFQSNTAYLQAVQSNLVASGLAWAKHHIDRELSDTKAQKTIELDISAIGTGNSNLTIIVDVTEGTKPEVQIKTSCSRARRTLNETKIYKIESINSF